MDFAQSRAHDPDKMGYICHQCHGKVTRKYWSKAAVEAAKEDPYCKRLGFAHEFVFSPDTGKTVKMGSVTMDGVQNQLVIFDEPVISIACQPEDGLILLNVRLHDEKGQLFLEIVDNEWRIRPSSWDVECVGGRVALQRKSGDKPLIISSRDDGVLEFQNMDFKHRGVRITADRAGMQAHFPNRPPITIHGAHLADAISGIVIG
ncbi:MAG: hypothetical protein MK180_13685 [Rhodobacteraceae bacterium]|nr:hypothetical protein [Paracoccaceae bacterium]